LPHAQVKALNPKLMMLSGMVSAARKSIEIIRTAAADKSAADKDAELVETALASQEILHTNSLATVTKKFIVIPRPELKAQTIIGLPRISKIKHVETSRPGFLVIAAGAYTLAAAAACSKQGDQASIPLAGVGTLFVIAYFMTRRATVTFVVDREATETRPGRLPEAGQIVRAVVKALPQLLGNKPPHRS
jgi:hypothetical protein